MKITPTSLVLLYGDPNPEAGYFSVVGVACHSTVDNTVVKNWLFRNPKRTGSQKVSYELSSVPVEACSFPLPEGQSLVFSLALNCTYLTGGPNSLLIQGTGITTAHHLSSSSSINGQEVDLYEIPNEDMTIDQSYQPVFRLFLRAEKEEGDSSLPVAPKHTYEYIKLTRLFTKMRFPNFRFKTIEDFAPENGECNADSERDWLEYDSNPVLVLDRPVDKDCVTTDWIGGRPLPFWRVMPRLIRAQKAPAEFLRSLVEVTKDWVEPASSDREMRWAQLACQLGANTFPYAPDYCVIFRKGTEDYVRDITFPVTVFGFGDCEDVGYLSCSLWLLLRNCEGISPEWDSVRARMKAEYHEPMATYCRIPTGEEKTVCHVTCLVFPKDESGGGRGKGRVIMVDGVEPYNSFLADDAAAKECEDVFFKIKTMKNVWNHDDFRFQCSNYPDCSRISRQGLVAYLVDADGDYYFAEKTKGDTDGLLFGEILFSKLRKGVMPRETEHDTWSQSLKPLPPVRKGAITKTVDRGLTTAPDGAETVSRLFMICGSVELLLESLKDVGLTQSYAVRVERLKIRLLLPDVTTRVGEEVVVIHLCKK